MRLDDIWKVHFASHFSPVILDKNIVLELAFLHVAIGQDARGLSVQTINLELAFFESSVWQKPAITVQFVCACLKWNELALKYSIWPSLVPLAYDASLTKMFAILDGRNLLNALNSEIVVKLQFVVLKQLLDVQLGFFVQVFVQELSFFALVKDVTDLAIQDFLDQIYLWPLLEAVDADAPILKFDFQHLPIILLVLVKLAAIADEVDHHGEGLRISIDEKFTVFHLDFVAAAKHSLQCTALNLAQSRLADVEFFLSTNIELHNVTKWLDLANTLFLILPCLFFRL